MRPQPKPPTHAALAAHPLRRAPQPREGSAKVWRWALAGAMLGSLLALVCAAPARWLAAGVRWASQERVLLQQAQGTVWSGSAHLSLSGGPGSRDARSLPSRVHWQLGWAGPGLSLALRSDCCTPQPMQAQVRLSWGRAEVALSDQQSHWPLALLAGLGAPWNTLQAEGRLQWHSQGLRVVWAQGQWLWQGQSQWLVQDLASRLSTLRPMGSYRLTLQGGEGAPGSATPTLGLSTEAGPLRLSGQGQWSGQRLRFEGEASADEGSETALSNLLNIIGRRNGARSLLSLG